MNSKSIINAYKEINPNATDGNIRNIFKNNSGPVLYPTPDPGSEFGAAGKDEYDDRGSAIEINTKIFKYVEGQLEGKGTAKQKQLALMYLYVEISHEVGHEIGGYKGTDNIGTDIKLIPDQIKPGGEPGSVLENMVWGIPIDKNDKLSDRPDVIQGICPTNDKNKSGVMEGAVNKANASEEGKKTLPTVPQQ